MLHINRYLCSVFGCQMELPYIVGVATKDTCRRQGVMRNTLERVLHDLECQNVPFAYLMPAKEEYYYDFGFRKVSEWQTCEVKPDIEPKKKDFFFVSYEDMKGRGDLWHNVLTQIHTTLQEKYDIFAVHDEAYFDLLYAEKTCQDGDVIFVFDNACEKMRFCGCFAYVLDQDTPVIEQVLCDEARMVCAKFFENYPLVKCVHAYPYMIRIVHRESFVALFKDVLVGVSIDKLTDEELIEIVRQRKNCFYFAEIV